MEVADARVAREPQYRADAFARGAWRAQWMRPLDRHLAAVATGNCRPISRAQLPIDTVTLARYLIGKVVVRALADTIVSGRIVETEAYVVGDAASHAYRGMTPRNRVLFLERGHAYLYLIYGVSYMLNVSSEMPGIGAGVLIRALQPLDGIATMRTNRGVERLQDLARGPGRPCAALRIDRALDGTDLCREGPLWLGQDGQAGADIAESTRIGITRDAERLLRFYVRGSPFVSGPASLRP